MKDGGSFEQCYNAQAAVEVETMLIVGKRVSDAPNDKEQMQPTLAVVSPVAGAVGAVLIDSGYYSEKAVTSVEDGGHGPKVYAAVKRQGHSRSVSQLEERPDPPRSAPIRRLERKRARSWRTGWRQRREGNSTNCENKPSNQSSASSRKRSGSGASCCVVWRK